MKRLFIIFLALSAMVSCEQARIDDEPETVEVTLTLSGAPLAKADSPLIPDVENLIYDVWILQYDKMGLLIDKGTSHQRATSSGSLTATVTTTFAAGEGNTICVLANLDKGDVYASRVWPQTLTEFKNSCDVVNLSADIDAANAGTLTDMPMFGYWEGDISVETNNVQVSLGRMLTRINLVINNQSSSSMTVNSISNVSTKVYAFPDVFHAALPADAYAEISIGQEVAAGKTKELYFYMAPNFTEAPSENQATDPNPDHRPTMLYISDKDPVILSNGSPSDTPRDYNLYHNSNYTFTININ
ncbi:MAG: DUF4906 domain-containing protein [Bacteroidales bacterium]|nr:DUF4906 domain-containing protein [Bacteroidales bacterium]